MGRAAFQRQHRPFTAAFEEHAMTRFKCPNHWTLQERLDHHTIPEPMTGCWLCWSRLGPRKNNYSHLSYKGKTIASHRASYELHKGRIPQGLSVLHRCHTPACVNPDHLRVGTHRENMEDMIARGRRETRARGTAIGIAKLTDESAMNVYLATGSVSSISRRFGITRTAVRSVKSRRTWKHIHNN